VTSRERVDAALAHRQPDRAPLDLGASAVTGMHASSVYKLRQALRLDRPGTPVKVVEPYQVLGEIAPDLLDALGVDVVGLGKRETLFGFRNEGWKEWKLFDGTPVLVPEGFNTRPEPNGDILLYPEGDRSVPASGRMPNGGYYFDSIVRQPPIVEDRLDPADNLEEFQPVPDGDVAWFAAEARRLEAGGRAVLANFGGTSFGDIALVPAPWLKRPKGIRDVEEWYVSTATRREYVRRVFERQCEIALANLERIRAAVGNRAAAIFVTGTDFGTQAGTFIAPEVYRDLFQPFHRAVNDWVHARTEWKTFIHTCGSVVRLLPDFIEAGFDILNPVQCSAAGMDARALKQRFGDRIVFWGGGVDTQRTLPFGTPDDVRREVEENIAIFRQCKGYVVAPCHNLQSITPTENILALYESARR